MSNKSINRKNVKGQTSGTINKVLQKSCNLCGDSSKNEDIYSNVPPLEDIANMSNEKSDVPEVNLYVEIPKFDLGMSYNFSKEWVLLKNRMRETVENIKLKLLNTEDPKNSIEVKGINRKRDMENDYFPHLTAEEKSTHKRN